MKMHASHSDYLEYEVYLNDELVNSYWWADDETGEVEVYELSKETVQTLPKWKPVHKLVLDPKTNEPKKIILKGEVKIIKK